MIYIVLPVHNRKHFTARFVNCLQNQIFQDFKLFLVDDGSTDRTAEMVEAMLGKKVEIIRGEGNLWWAGSLQAAFQELVCLEAKPEDLVCVINNDLLIEPNFLNVAAEYFSQIPTQTKIMVGAVGKYFEKHASFQKGVHISWQPLTFTEVDDPKAINALATRGLFLKLSNLREVPQLWPKLLPHYLSDYEWTMRAQRQGFQLRVLETLNIFTLSDTHSEDSNLKTNKNEGYIVSLFLKRNPASPYFLSIFTLLCGPKKNLLKNLWHIWRPHLVTIYRTFIPRKPLTPLPLEGQYQGRFKSFFKARSFIKKHNAAASTYNSITAIDYAQKVTQDFLVTLPSLSASDPQYSFFVQEFEKMLTFLNKDVVRICDFGGALAKNYFLAKHLLGKSQKLEWIVCELPETSKRGRELWKEASLKFVESVSEVGQVDIVYSNSSLQYCEMPDETLRDWASLNPTFLYIDRTPVFELKESFVSIQAVPKSYFSAYLPVWIFSKNSIISKIEALGFTKTRYEETQETLLLNGNLFKIGALSFSKKATP